MPVIDVNGTPIWFDREGAGRPCLVVHGGLGIDHCLYRASLGPLADGCQVVYYDQRGNGRSFRPANSSINIEQLAADAAALSDQLGMGPAVVFGHSFGGFVAQELALRHPGRVAALLLVATTPGQLGTGEDPEAGRGAPLPDEAAQVMASLPADDHAVAEGMRRLLPWYLHRRDVDEVAAMMDGTVFSRDAMVQGFESLARWSAVDRLSTIAVPALVVVGTHDVFTSPPQARRISSRIRNSRLVELTDSGHFPWIDEPDRFFAVVADWLRTVPGT